MAEQWVPLRDLPAEGREFSFSDPAFWDQAWREYRLHCSMGKEPLAAVLRVLPQDDGVYLEGRLTGTVIMPCDRCARPTEIVLDAPFQEFEPYPDDEGTDEDGDEPRIREKHGRFELDAGTLVWEQFVLALPFKPLCSETCKGLCPTCGADLNEGPCGCDEGGLDPRLAALRTLKLS